MAIVVARSVPSAESFLLPVSYCYASAFVLAAGVTSQTVYEVPLAYASVAFSIVNTVTPFRICCTELLPATCSPICTLTFHGVSAFHLWYLSHAINIQCFPLRLSAVPQYAYRLRVIAVLLPD